VSLFTTVTVTSGSNAPVESVTVPRMSPEFVLWANTLPTIKAQTTAKNLIANQADFICLPKVLPLRESIHVASIRANICYVISEP
jgi:hypothetical protein